MVTSVYSDSMVHVDPVLEDIYKDIGIPEDLWPRMTVYLTPIIKDCEGSISHNCLSCMASVYADCLKARQ